MSEKLSDRIRQRFTRAYHAESFPGAANALFGGIADLNKDVFRDLEKDLRQANIRVLYRTYVSLLFMVTAMAFFSGLGMALVFIALLPWGFFLEAVFLIAFPIIVTTIAFGAMYLYPAWRARKRSANIKMNLPFALNHMSAISGSGVAPSSMFQLLVNFDEYGEISNEAERITTRIQAFGDDVTTSIRDVARQTPSEDLKETLYGVVSTIETGGSLQAYLKEAADRTLFDYKIEREKQIERLTTFASFYTALLVAAPLFLIVILAILEIIGGSLFGMPIKSTCGVLGALQGQCPIGVIDIGAYIVIPIANTLFIIILEVTQPEL